MKSIVQFVHFPSGEAFLAVDEKVLATTAYANQVDIEDAASRLAGVMGQELHRHFVTETDIPYEELARRFCSTLQDPPRSLPPARAAEAAAEGWQLFTGLTIGRADGSDVLDSDGAAWLHVCRRAKDDPSSAAAYALRILAHYRPRRYRTIIEFPSGPVAERVATLQVEHEARHQQTGS